MTNRPLKEVGIVVLVLVIVFSGVLNKGLTVEKSKHKQKYSFLEWSWRQHDVNNRTRTAGPLHVVYHVGPAKMGSTSIQIGALQHYQQELHEDGYNVYSFRDASQLNKCLKSNTWCRKQPEWKHFMTFMKNAKQKGRHIVISTESDWNHLSNDTILFAAYHDIFSSLAYHVRIVISYRPLYEYWPSLYFQQYNHYCGYSHVNVGEIPSFVDFLENMNKTTQLRHPSYEALQHARKYFHDVFILPLSDELIKRFLCSAVIGASRACNAVNEENEYDAVENQRHSLQYDRLAQAARSKGISQLPCKMLSNQTQQRLQLSENQSSGTQELATTCLNPSQLRWLWNKTLYYHHYMLPSNTTTQTDEELKVHFQKASTTTLCQVNVEQVLVDHPELFTEKKKKTQTDGRKPTP
jgi:hypothetical protein